MHTKYKYSYDARTYRQGELFVLFQLLYGVPKPVVLFLDRRHQLAVTEPATDRRLLLPSRWLGG